MMKPAFQSMCLAGIISLSLAGCGGDRQDGQTVDVRNAGQQESAVDRKANEPKKVGQDLETFLADNASDDAVEEVEIIVADPEPRDFPVEEHSAVARVTPYGHKVHLNDADVDDLKVEELNEKIARNLQKKRDELAKRDEKLVADFIQRARSREKVRAGWSSVPAIDWSKARIGGLGITVSLRKDQLRKLTSENYDGIGFANKKLKAIPQTVGASSAVHVSTFAYPRGYTGAGVGIWNAWCHPKVNSAALSGKVTKLNIPIIKDCTIYEYSEHETKVSEVMVSKIPEMLGIAYGAHVYSGAGEQPAEVSDIPLDVTLSPRVYVVNKSAILGYDPTYRESNRIWDDYVYNNRVVAVLSSGDEAFKPSGFPASAHNVISVGGYDDRMRYECSDGTIYDSQSLCLSRCVGGTCTNPIVAVWSTYMNPNPANGDREFPNVVAPGQNIVTPTFGAAAGTSLSAPVVSGMAAVLISSDPVFKYRPEMVKASIIGGAYRNIEGDRRLSDKDGAGGVDYLYTHPEYRTTYYYEGGNSSFFNSSSEKEVYYWMYANKRVRAALVWSSPGAWPRTHDGEPQMDLNLYVYAPNGSLVAQSTSLHNSFEITDFDSTIAGTYRFVIRRVGNRSSASIPLSGIKMALSIGRNE